MVARLEHPHIVPLYDYWREPDGAFLVMRYVRGGSLEDLLRGGPVPLERAAQILDQIGAALAVAHHQGVVHRDVKPGNVLLDEEGNAYLSDFSIALETGAPEQTAGTMIRGTPAYLSPEQIRLEKATPRSDIYALGVVLFEMLTAEHPFPGTSLTVLLNQHLHQPIPSVRGKRPEIPPAVDATIGRATAKDPEARFPDVLELAAAFRSAVEGAGRLVVTAGEMRNPYKGLRAFLEADSADFFGREILTRRLIERIAETGDPRFLCAVGPSGSGKSSVVRAGLVPAIRRGVIPGSDRWYVIEVLPGAHPMRELETALLGVSVEPPPSLLEDLERDEFGLARAVAKLLPDPEAELLIVLDQLEEIFTMVQDEAERVHVLESIRAATADPASRIRVIATLRADFYDQPLSVRGFGDLLAARNEAITPMSPEELERAIVGPAERVGLDIEPGLVAAMVADVVDRPGALPLLQYALTELADRKDVGSAHAERLPPDRRRVRRPRAARRAPVRRPGRRRSRRLPAAVPATGDHRRGRGGHSAPGPPLRACVLRRPRDRRGDRRVRTAPPPLVRPRPGLARADRRDRPRGPPRRLGPLARLGRRCARRPTDQERRRDLGRRVDDLRSGRELPAARRPPRADRDVGRDDQRRALTDRRGAPGREPAPARGGAFERTGPPRPGAQPRASLGQAAPCARRRARGRRPRRGNAHGRGPEPDFERPAGLPPGGRAGTRRGGSSEPRERPSARDPARARGDPDVAGHRRDRPAGSRGGPAPRLAGRRYRHDVGGGHVGHRYQVLIRRHGGRHRRGGWIRGVGFSGPARGASGRHLQRHATASSAPTSSTSI